MFIEFCSPTSDHRVLIIEFCSTNFDVIIDGKLDVIDWRKGEHTR